MNYLGMFGEINAPHLLQSEVDRLRAKFPNLSDSPSVSTDANTAPLSSGGESDLPFVNTQTGD